MFSSRFLRPLSIHPHADGDVLPDRVRPRAPEGAAARAQGHRGTQLRDQLAASRQNIDALPVPGRLRRVSFDIGLLSHFFSCYESCSF